MDDGIEVRDLNFSVSDESLPGGGEEGSGITITVRQFTLHVSEGMLNGLIERFLPNESLQVTLGAGGARVTRASGERRTSIVLEPSEVRLDLGEHGAELRCEPQKDARAD